MRLNGDFNAAVILLPRSVVNTIFVLTSVSETPKFANTSIIFFLKLRQLCTDPALRQHKKRNFRKKNRLFRKKSSCAVKHIYFPRL